MEAEARFRELAAGLVFSGGLAFLNRYEILIHGLYYWNLAVGLLYALGLGAVVAWVQEGCSRHFVDCFIHYHGFDLENLEMSVLMLAGTFYGIYAETCVSLSTWELAQVARAYEAALRARGVALPEFVSTPHAIYWLYRFAEIPKE